jgi:hypothetical protein
MNQKMSDSQPSWIRRAIAWWLVRLRPTSIRPAEIEVDQKAVARGLQAIKDRDPLFDGEAVLAAARRFGFLTYVVRMTGTTDAVEDLVTEGFWGSAVGAQLETGRGPDQMASTPPGQAGSASPAGARYPLDFSIRQSEIVDVKADQRGLDRVTVRLGWCGCLAVTGLVAETMRGWAGDIDTGGGRGGPVRRQTFGWYDLEFVRPTNETTSPVSSGWRCGDCGAPYDSDLERSCEHCGTARTVPEGEWLLTHGWLVASPA